MFSAGDWQVAVRREEKEGGGGHGERSAPGRSASRQAVLTLSASISHRVSDMNRPAVYIEGPGEGQGPGEELLEGAWLRFEILER